MPYFSSYPIYHISMEKHLRNLYTKKFRPSKKPCQQINIFLERVFGEQTDSAVPLIHLLVNNVSRFYALIFTHLWHKTLPNVFHDFFQYASILHIYNPGYAVSQNLHKSLVRTNTGKQTISYMASIFFHDIPYLKNLNQHHAVF